jgi:hypothetical protein
MKTETLLIAAAAFGAGYLLSKAYAPAAAPTSPMTQLPPSWPDNVYTANAVRGIGVAQYGNCQCANGTMCVGRGNCECCTKSGGMRIHTIITGQPMQAKVRSINGYGGLA